MNRLRIIKGFQYIYHLGSILFINSYRYVQIFYSEFNRNYSNYTFSYAVYAVIDEGDTLTQAYEKGFLPYSGVHEYSRPGQIREIFYLARSLRVDLTQFEMRSENKRVLRSASDLNIEMELLAKQEVVDDSAFQEFCSDYARERFSSGELPEARWNYILKRSCGTHIFRFSIDGKPIGYVLAGMDARSVHYWFSFFDTSYFDKFPIGKYLMTSVIKWAKEQGKAHIYLGTCYGRKSLYKARDFKGAEFFEGSSWKADRALLKSWCNSDDQPMDLDRYKMD